MKQRQSSNHSGTASAVQMDVLSQSSVKRQRINPRLSWTESDLSKHSRSSTFLGWSLAESFCSQLIEAGFYKCNVGDRVICLHCNLICQQWKFEVDDPCEVHTILSPECLFVKSMSCRHRWQYENIVPTLPSHMDYMDPKNRSTSFSTLSNEAFSLVDSRVNAGFFYKDSKVVCFYCNGSLKIGECNNHLIAEHVRRFPHCNYARHLCGDNLHQKIQGSIMSEPANIASGQSRNPCRQLRKCDDDTLEKSVADGLDLIFSTKPLLVYKFPRQVIESCLRKQCELTGDGFANSSDLYIACQILRKQTELIDENKENIVIPSIALKEIYERRERSSLNNPSQLYTDILISFENDLQTYQNAQKALQFTEYESITIKREHSLYTWSVSDKPSQRDMIKGGWIKCNTEDDTTQCPHCYVLYQNWKLNDNPVLIHQYLSPLCLFVLASKPFNANPIPIKKTHEQFTDEAIENADSQPYNGIVPTRHHSVFQIAARQISFNGLPHNPRVDTEELAVQGFHCINRNGSIQCFYCDRIFRSNQCTKVLHSLSRCRYIRQLNDRDPVAGTRQSTVSHKCICCKTEDRRLLALPCRHFCLCESCGQFKRVCPMCNRGVEVYAIIYPS